MNQSQLELVKKQCKFSKLWITIFFKSTLHILQVKLTTNNIFFTKSLDSYLNKFMEIFAVLFKNISGSIQSINCLRLGNTNIFIESLNYIIYILENSPKQISITVGLKPCFYNLIETKNLHELLA